MVRLFPPDDIVPEPEFRGMNHLPATALRSVVEQLYALPVSVSYDLRQVSCALHAHKLIDVDYNPSSPFKRDFSSLLSIEVCRGLREGRRDKVTLEAVIADVKERLLATRAIANWLRTENQQLVVSESAPMLRLAKKPFLLHSTFDPLNAGDLDVLRAFELLENRAGLLDTLIRLAQPVRTRRDAGRCIAGMQLKEQRKIGWEYLLVFAVPPESQDAELSSDSLGLILTNDDPDLRLNPTMWSEVACRIDPSSRTPAYLVHIRMWPKVFDGPVFQQMLRTTGERGWCIDQSFIDFNSDKAEAFLDYLAAG
jgi:hypothetical protein